MVEVTQADSGFTAENIADAEWLWTNLPTFPRNWSTLPTHEKALIIHTAQRHRIAAEKAVLDRLRNLPDDVAKPLEKIVWDKYGLPVDHIDIQDIATALADAMEANNGQ